MTNARVTDRVVTVADTQTMITDRPRDVTRCRDHSRRSAPTIPWMGAIQPWHLAVVVGCPAIVAVIVVIMARKNR